jgi:hypothetical protein
MFGGVKRAVSHTHDFRQVDLVAGDRESDADGHARGVFVDRDFPGRAGLADILGILRGLVVGYSDHQRGKFLAAVPSHYNAVVARE